MWGGAGDHPRSRGVYVLGAGVAARPAGSSPLARGLQELGAQGRRFGGIIPARAGFTGGTIPAGEASWDHPRSRGVYFPALCVDQVLNGSSPLARGLRG